MPFIILFDYLAEIWCYLARLDLFFWYLSNFPLCRLVPVLYPYWSNLSQSGTLIWSSTGTAGMSSDPFFLIYPVSSALSHGGLKACYFSLVLVATWGWHVLGSTAPRDLFKLSNINHSYFQCQDWRVVLSEHFKSAFYQDSLHQASSWSEFTTCINQEFCPLVHWRELQAAHWAVTHRARARAGLDGRDVYHSFRM